MSKEGEEFIKQAYDLGAIKEAPDLPENQNLVHPLERLVQVDLAMLEILANMKRQKPREGLVSRIVHKISTTIPHSSNDK